MVQIFSNLRLIAGLLAENLGGPYKTMRVNNFNKLHIMASVTHNEKSGICKVIQGGILKPALLYRDYQNLGSPYKTVQVIISIGYILCLRQYTAKNQALTK